MKLTVYGNNATCPQATGACACYLLEAAGKKILLDMGCGSLPQLLQKIDLKDVDLIILSHLHFDHFGDLFCAKYQLETRRALGEEIPRIALCSPALPQWAGEELLSGNIFQFIPMYHEKQLTFHGLNLTFFQVPHLVESYAVRICGDGKVFTYSGDSAASEALLRAVQGVDCLLCEATLLNEQTLEASHHLTAGQAGMMARRGNVKRLLLTHYYPEKSSQILEQAQEAFASVEMTHIMEQYEI